MEVIFTRDTVDLATHADNDVAEGSVVHVEAALEKYPADVDTQRIALLDMVIHKSREEVVSRCDGVHISGEVQVDVLHGNYLSVSAACGAAFDSEHRTEGRLTQSQDSLSAGLVHGFAETYRSGGLALARRSRIDRSNEYQLAVGLVCEAVEQVLVQLCLVVAVLLYFVLLNAEVRGYLADLLHLRLLSDLNICKHFMSSVIYISVS